jgi:alpha-amylase
MGTAFHLAWTYGFQRIMSSYEFTDTEASPPMDANENTLPVIINPDGTCGNGWVCEHRWPQIANMVAFRAAVDGMYQLSTIFDLKV